MESTVYDSHAFVEQRIPVSSAGELFNVGESAQVQYTLEQEEEEDRPPAHTSASRNDDQPRNSRKRAAEAHSPPDVSSASTGAASQVASGPGTSRASGPASTGGSGSEAPSAAPVTKRTLQNRKAQREFRVRRAHYLKELEERVRSYESGGPGNVMEMQQTIAHLGRENQYLRNVTDRLQDELQAERAQSHSLHGQLLELHARLQESLAAPGASRQQGSVEGPSQGYQQQPTPVRRMRLQTLPQYSTSTLGDSQSSMGMSEPVTVANPGQTRGSWAMRPLPAFRPTLHGEPSSVITRQVASASYPGDTGGSSAPASIAAPSYAAATGLPVTPTTEIVSPFQRVVQLVPPRHTVEPEAASELAPTDAAQQDSEPHQTYGGLPDDLAEFSDPHFSLDTPPLSSPDLPLDLRNAQQFQPADSASQLNHGNGQAMPSPGQADEVGSFGYFDNGDSRTVRFSSGEVAPAPARTWLAAEPLLGHSSAHPPKVQPTAPQRVPPTGMVTSWNPYIRQTSATLGYQASVPASPAVGAAGSVQASWTLPAAADPMPSPPLYIPQHQQQSMPQSQSHAPSPQQQYPAHVIARSIPQTKAPRQAYQRAPTPHPRPRPRNERTLSLQSIPTPAPSTSGLMDDSSRPSTGSSVAFLSSQPAQPQTEYSSMSNPP